MSHHGKEFLHRTHQQLGWISFWMNQMFPTRCVLWENLTEFLLAKYRAYILLYLVILIYVQFHWWALVFWVCASIVWRYLSLENPLMFMTGSCVSFFFVLKSNCEVSFEPFMILGRSVVAENYKCNHMYFIVLSLFSFSEF